MKITKEMRRAKVGDVVVITKMHPVNPWYGTRGMRGKRIELESITLHENMNFAFIDGIVIDPFGTMGIGDWIATYGVEFKIINP